MAAVVRRSRATYHRAGGFDADHGPQFLDSLVGHRVGSPLGLSDAMALLVAR